MERLIHINFIVAKAILEYICVSNAVIALETHTSEHWNIFAFFNNLSILLAGE